DVESRLGFSPVQRMPLPEMVWRAYALGSFLALWAVEGVGHVYGEQALRESSTPRGLLTRPEADAAGAGGPAQPPARGRPPLRQDLARRVDAGQCRRRAAGHHPPVRVALPRELAARLRRRGLRVARPGDPDLPPGPDRGRRPGTAAIGRRPRGLLLARGRPG